MPSAYAASSSSCARARRSSRLRSPGRSRSRPEVMYAGRPIAASPKPSRPMRGNLAAGGQDRSMARSEEAQGEFTRDSRYITTRITADGRDGYPVEPGRYRLVVGRACPWANRAIIVRRLLGLEDVLSMGICGPTHDERSWTFDLDPGGRDPVLGIERLQEAYFARVPRLRHGASRCPAIVDIPTGQVVTNDFPQITLDLSTEWRPYHRDGRAGPLPGGAAATRSTRSCERVYTRRQQRRLPVRVRRRPSRRTTRRTTGCSARSTGSRTGWPTGGTSSATRSPRPTCGCSPRWPGSTPSTTATSSATGRS